uniref:glutathione transferase n=1 Tax=Actias selene TaxID=37776 RepID=G9HVH1_9NEOP|nr:24 kDa female-specific fat body protein [Actias selene]
MALVYRLKSYYYVGDAESIRYLLAYAGIRFENIVLKKDVTWPELQKTLPFGKLPVLEVDNKVLFQSIPLTWYVAKDLGLSSSDIFEEAEFGSISITVHELGEKVVQWFVEEDKYKKEKLETELTQVVFPKYLTDFEIIAQKKGGYFGGKKISWSDIYFAAILVTVQTLWNKDLLQKQYPLLYQIYRDVHNIPAIKAYVTKYVPGYKY